jgi:NH3-dependent NAD+ synthetase
MSKIDSTLVDFTQSNIDSFIDNVTMNLEALGVGPLKTDTDKFFDEVTQFIINKYNKSAHKRNSAPFTKFSND